MTESGTETPGDRLILRGQLTDMTQLPGWVAALATRHSIPEDLQFAIDICLEEAVSNVIRHGYAGVTEGPVEVSFTRTQDGRYEFVVEDHAPHFNPLEAPERPARDALDEARVGGRGIRLLRQFARSLDYEPTLDGNRLRLSF